MGPRISRRRLHHEGQRCEIIRAVLAVPFPRFHATYAYSYRTTDRPRFGSSGENLASRLGSDDVDSAPLLIVRESRTGCNCCKARCNQPKGGGRYVELRIIECLRFIRRYIADLGNLHGLNAALARMTSWVRLSALGSPHTFDRRWLRTNLQASSLLRYMIGRSHDDEPCISGRTDADIGTLEPLMHLQS